MNAPHFAAAAALWLSLVTPAHALTLLSSIALPAPVTQARASVDGTTLVVQLQAKPGMPAPLLVFDTSNPAEPKQLGVLNLPANGDLALSGDGRRALVRVGQQSPLHGAETVHTIIAVDLAEPRSPRVLWDQQVSALHSVLASQANAFAYARPAAGNDGKWDIVVVTGHDRRLRSTISGVYPNYEGMVLSAQAKFFARVSLGSLQVWDLRQKTPSLLEHEMSLVSERFASGCAPTVLDSGHVAILDGRVSRLGIYKAASGVPRIAKLAVEGNSACYVLNPNSETASFDFGDADGRVTRIGLGEIRAPAARGAWQLPPLNISLATARDRLFSAAPGARLQVFRLDSEASSAVDGRVLEDAYRAALEALRAAKKKDGNEFAAQWGAVNQLEEAGVLQALTAPISGVSDHRAAAILNDYGFLASLTGRPDRRAELALRKAIALHPGRAVAHLNLADLLRRDLGKFAAMGGDINRRRREIESHYRAYLANGGRATPAITTFLARDPGAGAKNDCEAIAAWANTGRLEELMSEVGINLPWHEKRIDLILKTEGTAHGPTFYAFDAKDDRPLSPDSVTDLQSLAADLWGGDALAVLTLRGKRYVVHHRGRPVVAALAGSMTCHFDFATTETIGPMALEPELCSALQTDKSIDELTFDGESAIEPATLQETHHSTHMVGTRELDFSNDGAPLNVAELQLSSSRGAGCERKFYELLDAEGAQIMKGPMRDQLSELQSGVGGECGNQARFFEHRGRIFFETKPAVWPPRDKWDQYHRVTTVREARVVDVCDFKFKSSVSTR